MPLPLLTRGAPRLLAAAAVLATVGCAPQSIRTDSVRSAEEAAARTIELEPGPRPAVVPGTLPTLRSADARRGMRTIGTDTAPALRISTGIREYDDVWQRIRARLSMPRPMNAAVRDEVAWYARNQDYVDRLVERARPFLRYIVDQVEGRGLPIEFALLPVVESAFQPHAYSPARAAGLWQFIPSTARIYGLRMNWWYDGRRDVVDSTRAALDYVQKLGNDFDGDWLLAVAGYNWGEGNVERAVARNRKSGKDTDFWSLRVPRETRAYVPRWLAVIEIVARPEKHGIRLDPIPDEMPFHIAEVDSQIDLAVAADAAGVELEALYSLNPGFNRWMTDPEGPHRLLLPAGSAARFRDTIERIPTTQRVAWRRLEIEPGDSLARIAARYGTTAEVIGQANEVTDGALRVGLTLMVPTSAAAVESYASSRKARRASGAPAADRRRVVYAVRSGDSLWSIGRRRQVTVRQLAAWNGLDARHVLRPGQRLVIWERASPRLAGMAAPAAGARRYVVRNGDNLWTIARRSGVPLKKLTEWNGMDEDDVLHPGQQLRLHPVSATAAPAPAPAPTRPTTSYTVRRGDSLWGIARRFDLSVAALRELNGLHENATLHPGQKLKLRLSGADET